MKKTQLALALAGILISAQAFALQTTPVTKAQLESPALPVQQTWITGSSAAVFPEFDSFTLGCNAGTVSVFTDGVQGNKVGSYANSAGNGTNFTAIACTRGTGSNEKYAVMYQSIAGGSLFAISPHTLGLNNANGFVNRLKNLTLPSTACTGTATSFVNGTQTVPVTRGCPATAATVGTSTATSLTASAIPGDPTTLQLPAGGFLDVEPAAFPPALAGNFNAKGVSVQSQTGQVFGIVVNKELYRDLQVDQGLYTSTAAAISADANFDPLNAPSISKTQYATLVSSTGFHNDGSDLAPNSGVGKKITVFSRADTSGTQASSNIFFLNNPCAKGVSANLTAQGALTGSTYAVSPQGGTGGVKSGITAVAAGAYAIGLVSLENDWRVDVAVNNGYRFVKLDGVHPETGSVQANPEYPAGTPFYTGRLTAVNAQYPLQMEMYQFKANTTTAASNPLGDELLQNAIAQGGLSLLDKLSTPTVCTDVPRGVTLLPTGGSSCNNQFSATPDNVVSETNRAGNNCKASQF